MRPIFVVALVVSVVVTFCARSEGQELVTETENDNLVIRNLVVKDYPIILRLIR